MIWASESVAWQLRTFYGGDVAPEMAQWKTEVSVTIPIVESETHFQKTISSVSMCDFTFCVISMLNI
jgi:hypothetical protein